MRATENAVQSRLVDDAAAQRVGGRLDGPCRT